MVEGVEHKIRSLTRSSIAIMCSSTLPCAPLVLNNSKQQYDTVLFSLGVFLQFSF